MKTANDDAHVTGFNNVHVTSAPAGNLPNSKLEVASSLTLMNSHLWEQIEQLDSPLLLRRTRSDSRSLLDPLAVELQMPKLRSKAFAALNKFESITHITLSTRRDAETSPFAAYKEMSRHFKNFPSLLRKKNLLLGKGEYIFVWEFCKDAFPHMHVVFNANRSLLLKASTTVQQGWKCGGAFISEKQRGAYAAVGYLFKLFNEVETARLPDWVKLLTRFRRYKCFPRLI